MKKLYFGLTISLLTAITFGQNIAFEQVFAPPPAPYYADFEDVSHSSIGFSDIDNDNDQDVLITGDQNFTNTIAKLYPNDGNGVYTEVTGAGIPFEGVEDSSIAFADIDNDNDQDVLISGYSMGNNFGRITNLYRNISSLVTQIPVENTVFNKISIYPNPSQGQITIELDGLKNVSIGVYSVGGQLVYHKNNISDPTHQFELNANPGIYILELSTLYAQQHYKLIKE